VYLIEEKWLTAYVGAVKMPSNSDGTCDRAQGCRHFLTALLTALLERDRDRLEVGSSSVPPRTSCRRDTPEKSSRANLSVADAVSIWDHVKCKLLNSLRLVENLAFYRGWKVILDIDVPNR